MTMTVNWAAIREGICPDISTGQETGKRKRKSRSSIAGQFSHPVPMANSSVHCAQLDGGDINLHTPRPQLLGTPPPARPQLLGTPPPSRPQLLGTPPPSRPQLLGTPPPSRPQLLGTPPPSETQPPMYRMVNPSKGFNLAERLLEYWHSDDDKDLCIVARDGRVLVHSAVLAAACPTFRLLHNQDTSVLTVPDFDVGVVLAVVGLVYTGQLVVNIHLLPRAKELLHVLQLPIRLGEGTEGVIKKQLAKIELVARAGDAGVKKDIAAQVDADLIDFKVDEILCEKMQIDKHDKSHFCNFCNRCFDSLNKVNLHVKQFHQTRQPSLFTCQNCSTCFTSASDLQTHQNLCHQQSQQSANKPPTVCDKNLFPVNIPLDIERIEKSKEELDINIEMTPPPKPKRKHEKRNLPEQANVNYQEAITIFVCGVCQTKTNNFYPELKKHYETTHFIKEEKTYYCPSCNKKIVSTNSFHAHIHIVHREAKFACSKCVKKFKTAGSLEHHFTRWHTTERPYVCEDCGEGMASALHLEAHMRMHKSNNVCDECGKKFLSASHLEKHRVVHTNDRPFMCGTCGKTFRDPYSVKECEMKHQGITKIKPSQMIPWRNREAKYVCDLCGYRTKGKAALDRHIRGRHTDERPFTCQHCGKDFKSKSSLDAHGSVHGKQLRQPGKRKPERSEEGGTEEMIKVEPQQTGNGTLQDEQAGPKTGHNMVVGQQKVQGLLSQQDVLTHLAQQVPVSMASLRGDVSMASLRGDKMVAQLSRHHTGQTPHNSLTHGHQMLTHKASSGAHSTHGQATSTQTQPSSTHSQPIAAHSQPVVTHSQPMVTHSQASLCTPLQSLGVPAHLQAIPGHREKLVCLQAPHEKLVCLQAPHPQDVLLHRPATAAYFWMQQQLPPQ